MNGGGITSEFTEDIKKLMLLHRLCVMRAATKLSLYPGQPPVLDYIIEHEGCTQADIAAAMGVSPASIACSTKRMQAAELLIKSVDEDCLRRNRLYTTEKGRNAAGDFNRIIDGLEARLLTGFSDFEVGFMDDCVKRMTANIEYGADMTVEGIVEELRNVRESN